ncbi:hypothetical protein AX15_000333 [Amanita polypyramis BW_CC]|nr:hypothetical protein AX15_000333 [Amanita polypyramis BW_CC]
MKKGIVLFGFCILATASSEAPQVQLGHTIITGKSLSQLHQDFFGGIPFAESPVGKLRLQPPILKTDLGVSHFDASNFGTACVQPGLSVNHMSEDCLTINILRPSGLSPTSKLPVLFWTYGGAFQIGESFLYNGSAIVAQSIARGTPLIYVNFNYRLGPLGFPQGKEAVRRNALNLGIKDQIAALEWVQQNIIYFGGDSRKVTLFGESAGSIMTGVLFLGHEVERYARAAIFESGSASSALNPGAGLHEHDWSDFVRNVPSCASRARSSHTFHCLQATNSTEVTKGLLAAISEASDITAFGPTIDGPGGVLPDFPSRLFAKGQFARLPFIAGTNLDEGTLFTDSQINSESTVRRILVGNFSPPAVSSRVLHSSVGRILKLYPNDPALGSPFNTGNNTFGLSAFYKQTAAIVGDIIFQSQRRSWIQTASCAGVKTYGYLFTEPQPDYPAALGVPHGSEIYFVYGAPRNKTASAVQLSRIMMDYWISFATSLDPNDGHGVPRPHWKQYTSQHQTLMQLNGKNLTMIPDDYRKEQIDYINSNPLVWYH